MIPGDNGSVAARTMSYARYCILNGNTLLFERRGWLGVEIAACTVTPSALWLFNMILVLPKGRARQFPCMAEAQETRWWTFMSSIFAWTVLIQ
jgi:hypothetical protein